MRSTEAASLAPLKVFLSSTFHEFRDERALVERAINRLGAAFIGMENFGSFTEEPIRRCLRKVESADVVVLLLGNEFGSRVPLRVMSFTEAEYRHAVRRNIPVLAYVLGDSEGRRLPSRLNWMPPASLSDEAIAEASMSARSDSRTRMATLEHSIARSRGVSAFCGGEDLAWKVASDLARECMAIRTAPLMNDLLMKQITSNIDDLVALLERRAHTIRKQLSANVEYVGVRWLIRSFNKLHTQHVGALRAGKLLLAHNILTEIHRLSIDLEINEEITRRSKGDPAEALRLYNIGMPGPGILMCAYATGEMRSEAAGYPSELRALAGVSPDAAVRVYNHIVNLAAEQAE